MRGPVVRLALRRMERNFRREGRNAEAEAVSQALRNREIFDAVTAECEGGYASTYGGAFTDFFQWVLDHSEEIAAFIQMLIDLFAEEEAEELPST